MCSGNTADNFNSFFPITPLFLSVLLLVAVVVDAMERVLMSWVARISFVLLSVFTIVVAATLAAEGNFADLFSSEPEFESESEL